MSFLAGILNKVTVSGSSTSGSTNTLTGASTGGSVAGSGDAFTNGGGHQIDPSFLDSLYAAGKITAAQRESLLTRLDPRTLGLSDYDLWYLSGGQYGSRLLSIAGAVYPSAVVVLDQFITDAAEVAGAAAEVTVADRVLTIPANSLQVGDWIAFYWHFTQNGRNSTDTTQLKTKITNASGATVFDAGALALTSGMGVPMEGRIEILSIGATGTGRSVGSTGLGGGTGNTALTFDTTQPIVLASTVLHSSNNVANKTQLRAGYIHRIRKL